jgi:cytochrome c553
MAKLLRWTGYVLGAFLVLLLIAAVAVWLISARQLGHVVRKPERLAQPTAAQVADAPRQLRILRCLDCHGEGLRGTLFFNAPHVAKIYAPNITQVAAKATDEQLAQALRQGIGTDGRALVIMPSATFGRLDDRELAALIGAIRALPRTGQPTPAREIGPLGRIGLVSGKFHTTPEQVAEYARKFPIDLGPKFAVGRHMAASNCAECHGADVAGGEPEPGLKAPDLTIVGAYDLAGFTKLMRTGVPAGGRKLKLMDEIARSSLNHMTDAEIAELYAYLQARADKLSR